MILLKVRLPQMLQTLNRKIIQILLMMCMLLTCTSCNNKTNYKINEYLYTLADKSGILGYENNEEYLNQLQKWEIIDEEDTNHLNEDLTYKYLNKTIAKLIRENEKECLLKQGWISIFDDDDDIVSKEKALEVIDKATEKINNPKFENKIEKKEKDNIYSIDEYSFSGNKLKIGKKLNVGDIVYLEKEKAYKKIINQTTEYYNVTDPDIDEVLEELKISGSGELNLENAIVIDDSDDMSSYENTKLNLLASKRHSFTKNGFDISYKITSSSIDLHVSKDTKNGLNMFIDSSISNIKPTYNWDYQDGKLNNAFFKINYKMNNELGVSSGKRKNLKLDLKNVDKSSLKSIINSSFVKSNDEIENTIQICELKTPIPNIPTAYLNIDVVVNIYYSGKIEVVLYNTSQLGFEVNDGKLRLINDVDRDIDLIIGASAKATTGLNFNLEAVSFRLMDVEVDFGIRVSLGTTVHLYDDFGNLESIKVEATYDELDEVAKENENIKICGDVSLNWVLDLKINTSKTLLYKLGLSLKKEILDTDNQLFKNKTHIEDWQFVSKCTRKNRKTLDVSSENEDVDKISLSRYSIVIVVGNSLEIPIKALPKGYSTNDLEFSCEDNSVATIESGKIVAKTIGSTKINIKTKDNKYSAYINVLVSTG